MIAIVCVDDNMGMMFNHRRQSQDRILRERILQIFAGRHLWMNHYSAKQFGNDAQINTDEAFLYESAPDDVCFVEDTPLASYEQWIDKIVLYKWNRTYPADVHFDIPLAEHGWHLVSTEDFVGSSHEKITEEVYER